MEHMLVIMSRRGEAPREPVGFAEMGRFAAELAEKLHGGAPLLPEEQGVQVRVRRGQVETTDGLFAESKEVIGGYFMLDAKSDAEALEQAKRCPAARSGLVELDLDGPFAESKEVVGGYSILLARGRDEALALARGCPHARWGTVEVREIMNVPGPG